MEECMDEKNEGSTKKRMDDAERWKEKCSEPGELLC